MDNIELVRNERIIQQEKGYTLAHDASVNHTGQLNQAAQVLSLKKIPVSHYFEPPYGWDEDKWTQLCDHDYKKRLIIAAALLVAAADLHDRK